jgi:hypothetical protein
LKTISAVLRQATLRSKLVVAAIVIALCVGVVWARMRSALTPAERHIVGSWIIAKPTNQTTDLYTFTADRQFFASRIDRYGVTIGEDPPAPGETWWVQDKTLLIRRSKGGPFGLYNLLPWIHADLAYRLTHGRHAHRQRRSGIQATRLETLADDSGTAAVTPLNSQDDKSPQDYGYTRTVSVARLSSEPYFERIG